MQHFRILWFEDNIHDFDEIVKEIELHCSHHKKLFLYDHYTQYPHDFNVKMFDGKYSMAFIDLNLEEGQKGIEIIDILNIVNNV